MRRKEKGDCVYKVGKERFGFDENTELSKYKYLCCENMTGKEWKKRNGLPYSYYEWSRQIKSKYNQYNIEQLEEFSRYLELCVRNSNVYKESCDIIFAALAAAVITVIFDTIIVQIASRNDFFSNWRLLIIAFFGISVIVSVTVYVVVSWVKRGDFKKYFYSDYKEIIEEILVDKRENNTNHQN